MSHARGSTDAPVINARSDFSQMVPEIYSRDEHSISRSLIDPDALQIMYRLIRSGFKAYMVGGGVRDLLLGKKPKDFDITTDATPRRVKALFSNSRIIGRRFKLVHIFFGGGKNIEVSTFRDFTDPVEGDENEEVSQLAPDNKFGTEVTDALRRDITINGLFYDLATFSVIDYVGGIKDLSDRVIRVIGDAETRFREDPVRMLRVVRHAARTGFAIDRGAWNSIAELRGLIATCPQMRIFEELKKDLQSGHFLKILRVLAQSQLLDELLPELLGDYPALFDESSTASKLLGEIDERFRAGREPSVAVVLSVLALLASPALKRFDRREEATFESEEALREHLETCFKKLAVPRRERERVDALLIGWLFVLQHMEDSEGGIGAIEREGVFDLTVLLEIFGVEEKVIAMVEGSSERGRRSRGDDTGTRSGGGRRRRRGGRSRGPGRRESPPS